jgi:uncharacterized membrane protein
MTDPRLSAIERLLSRLMLAGITSSAISLLLGLVVLLVSPGAAVGTAIVTFGLMVLMATPALRVIVTVVESIRLRDWFFVATAIAVVVLLATTLGLALAH